MPVVDDWSDIVRLYVKSHYALGLKADGTFVMTGEAKGWRRDSTDWIVDELNAAAGLNKP